MQTISESQLRWLFQGAATLVPLGAEPVRGLVLPTPQFFPDAFDGSADAVKLLLQRIQEHAGFANTAIELAVVGEVPMQGGGCGSGACGTKAAAGILGSRISPAGNGYRLSLAGTEVQHPRMLSTALVRGVSEIFLLEAGAQSLTAEEGGEGYIDLAGALLGFGVLLSNGSYIYSKSCGGVSVSQATVLSLESMAAALGLFVSMHGVSPTLARQHLEPTPRQAFTDSLDWMRTNKSIFHQLKATPKTVAAGEFTLAPPKASVAAWLTSLFRKDAPHEADIPADLFAKGPKQPIDAAKAARLAEIRALMDEAG